MIMEQNHLDLNDLRIRYYPDPVLRKRADEITNITPELADLADTMIELMLKADGIGLAAPQVGLSIRLVTVNLTGKPQDAQVLINPVLSDFQGYQESHEGCLSLPGISGKVRRHAACTVQALDLDGNKFVIDLVDLPATCLQHETDHLNGVLFIDRLNAISRLACRKGLKVLESTYQTK